MKKSFVAKHTKFHEENDVYVFSFADSTEDTPKNHVILSRTDFLEDENDFGTYLCFVDQQ